VSLDALTVSGIAALVALTVAVIGLAVLYVRSRRSIVFDAWVDFAKDEGEGDRGKSLADLLLYDIREIQNAHQRSGRELDLKNPYDDIPAFQQELDSELKAAVELQRESRFVGPVVALLMALIPTRPARLRGSIHGFGDEIRVNVVLEQARGSSRVGGVPQWTGSAKSSEKLPDVIEDLAYEIYLALAQSAVFVNPKAFRCYTEALSSHLAFGTKHEAAEREGAEGLYDEALELEPRNPAALYNLGVLHYYLFLPDRNQKAEQCFRAAMAAAHGPLRAQIHSGLANVYSTAFHRFKSGEPTDLRAAIYHAEEALRLHDGLDVVLKAAAYAHHQSGEEEQRAARDASGDSERTRASRKAAEHCDKAVTYYRRAITVNPRYFTAHNNLGNLFLELAKTTADERTRRELLQSAVALFKDAMTIRPSYHHAYDNLGNAYYELALLGDDYLFGHAARYYRDAFALETGYAEAMNDLAMLYLTPKWTDNDPDEAQRIHREAMANAPDEKRRIELKKAFDGRQESVASGGAKPLPAGPDAGRLARRARRWRHRDRLLASLRPARHV